ADCAQFFRRMSLIRAASTAAPEAQKKACMEAMKDHKKITPRSPTTAYDSNICAAFAEYLRYPKDPKQVCAKIPAAARLKCESLAGDLNGAPTMSDSERKENKKWAFEWEEDAAFVKA